jgi:hypothetical protein
MPRLKINPIVKPAHYRFYFNVGRTTAWKMHKIDLAENNGKKLTFSKFNQMYDGYPDPTFKPVYVH